jgi:gas vesicle protein
LARTLQWLPRTTANVEEIPVMSSTLNDTIQAAKHVLESANDEASHAVGTAKHAIGSAADGAKHVMGSARDGAEHAAASARTTWLDGIKAVTGMVSMLRGLQADDALGLVGLSRRRSPVAAMGIFSAGVVVGAGAALLFAPMSGTETRRRLMSAFSGLKGDAKSTIVAVGTEVKADVTAAVHKVEDLASQAKDAVIAAEHQVEGGATALKDAASTKVDAAVQAVKSTATGSETGNGKSKNHHPS